VIPGPVGWIVSGIGGLTVAGGKIAEGQYDKSIAGAYGDYEAQLKQRDMMEDNAAKKRVENSKMQEYDYFSGMGNTQSARDGGLLKYGYGGKMKYQTAGPRKVPDTEPIGNDLSAKNAIKRLYYGAIDPKGESNVTNQLARLMPPTLIANTAAEGINKYGFQPYYKLTGNEKRLQQEAERQAVIEDQNMQLKEYKKLLESEGVNPLFKNGGMMKYQKGGKKYRRGVKKMSEFSNNFMKVASSPVQGVVTVADKYMKSQHPAVANFPYEDALNYYIDPVAKKGGRGVKKLDNFLNKTGRQITDTLFSKSQEKDKRERKNSLNQYRTGGGTDIVYEDGGAGVVTPVPGALTRIEGGADHEEKNNLGVKGVPNGVPVAFDGNEVQGEVENREVIDDTSMTEEILEASTNRGGGLAKGPYMFSQHMGVDGSKGENRTGPSYADARMQIAKLPPKQQMEATRVLMKSQEMASGDPSRAAKAGTYRDGGIQKYQVAGPQTGIPGISLPMPRGTYGTPVPQKQKFVSPFGTLPEEKAFQDYANAQEAGVTNGYGWGPKSAYAYGAYGDQYAKAQQNFNQSVTPITPTTWAQANTAPALAASTPTVPVASFNQGPLTRKGMRQQNRQQNLKDLKGGFNEYAGGAAALLGGVGRAIALGSIDPNEAPPPMSARDVKLDKLHQNSIYDTGKADREAKLLAVMGKDKGVGDPTNRYNALRQEGFREDEKIGGRIARENAELAMQYDFKNASISEIEQKLNQGKDLKTSESRSRIMDKVIDTKRNQTIAGGEIFAQSMKDFQSWKANQDLTRAMEGDRNVMSNFYNNNYPAFARKFKKGNPNATALEINQAFLASV
jgi:hypothetical protein